MELRICPFGEVEDLNELATTLLLTSLRLPLPLSLILPPKHGSRHSHFISGPTIPRKRIHATVAYSLCQEDQSARNLLSLKAVTAEDALHEEQ